MYICIYTIVISVLGLHVIQFVSPSLKFDWLCRLQPRKFPPRKFKVSVPLMKHTSDTGDRNLIKMSAERRGIPEYVCALFSLSSCLSVSLWALNYSFISQLRPRYKGQSHASGIAINAALI